MKRLVIVGSTGMLGSEIFRVANDANVEIVEVSRSRGTLFDAEKDEFDSLAKKLNLGEEDWLVNCIGWIPQKASPDARRNRRCAEVLNTVLPSKISESRLKLGFSWIQIGTDCVFSGKLGRYTEASSPDAEDLYGASKVQGELLSRGDIRIRCSLIGPDKKYSTGLYEWFRSHGYHESVKGFENHLWNGVSTTAVAKLIVGLFTAGETRRFRHHWVPLDIVSKFELLQIFEKYLETGNTITPFQTEQSIDRTLSTNDPELNLVLWKIAGYEGIPTIEALCEEFICMDKRLGS